MIAMSILIFALGLIIGSFLNVCISTAFRKNSPFILRAAHFAPHVEQQFASTITFQS